MKKKVILIIILLLIVPLLISFGIGIATNNKGLSQNTNDLYNGIDFPNYNDEKESRIKNNNSYIYVSVFTLICVTGGVWIYINQKKGM